ncbi:flagellar hook-associated protein FlgL [Thaumasiovibrio subtropicus]|uniref:flagellar hook-associated protein FlgL n=1 Tax=Thaumasiovibrio subtropicus TaxID=1891207 RepID=UPI000B35919D|nr:flagellar hook-associated protein FlgL [Thaumasiovibrio subtropicus]
MINRIASFHDYKSTAADIGRQQLNVHQNQQQLASGKRLLTAGDDPVASIYTQNFEQQEVQIDQYLKAITLGRNRVTNAESAISEAEQIADSAKRKTMLMINGSLATADREAHKQDMQGLYNSFMDLANTRDESGNYLFAGTQYNKQPFFRDNLNQVTYAGDSYQRMSQVAPAIDIPVNDAGDKVFLEVRNPYGDYKPSYSLTEGSNLLLVEGQNSNDADNSEYQVTFQTTPNGVTYELFQNGASVQSGLYDAQTGIQFNTLQLNFSGEMKDGDAITFNRQEHVNIFDAFKRVIELSEAENNDASANAELHHAAEVMSESFKHLNRVRSELGTRLQTLDRQENMHLDFKVVLAQSRGRLQDLDYSKAVIELNENMLALQASQQAFAKTKELTLFNFI